MAFMKRSRQAPGCWPRRPRRCSRGRDPCAARARDRKLVVYSAAPYHEIEEALDQSVSPVRLFTLIGGLTGCARGSMRSGCRSTGRPWGGKTIASIPPYVVIAFELTILLARSARCGGGALSVLMGKRGNRL